MIIMSISTILGSTKIGYGVIVVDLAFEIVC